MNRILCFHAFDSGRDIQALSAILYHLERYQNCSVTHGYLFESYKIARLKPDLVLMSNAVGSKEHVQLIKDCYDRKIPVFSLTAEGNMVDEYYRNNICWGWNHDKIIFQEKLCFWSNRTLNVFNEHYDNKYAEKCVVTGATGFDLYKMLTKHLTANKSLQELGSKYEAVIGYAGWAFGKVYSKPDLEHLSKVYKGDALHDYVDWVKAARQNVVDILTYAIESNPNYLFILKKHPREHSGALLEDPLNEMLPLEHFSNVLYVKDNQYSIIELIQICDVWTCFESTTVMEAWLSQTPTINIIPNNDRRMKTYVAEGSLICTDKESFESSIQSLLKENQSFNEAPFILNDIQKYIISNAVGFSDGLNHLRVVKLIVEILSADKKASADFVLTKSDVKHWLLLRSMNILNRIPLIKQIHKVKKHKFFTELFKQEVLQNELEKYYHICESFYADFDPQKALAAIELRSESTA